jgi:transcriptional regulator with XRE-family HTH domain
MNTQADWPGRLTRSIATEIRRHRTARRMSAQQLANACAKLGVDLPRSTLADLENGRRTSLSVAELLAIARVLDLPPLLLVFPVGVEKETEVLPGAFRPTFRAAQWFGGEYPFPGADDGMRLRPGWTSEAARPLALHREHDRAAAEALAAAMAAGQLQELAAGTTDEAQRAVLAAAIESFDRTVRESQEAARRLREEACKRGWHPPAAVLPVPD